MWVVLIFRVFFHLFWKSLCTSCTIYFFEIVRYYMCIIYLVFFLSIFLFLKLEPDVFIISPRLMAILCHKAKKHTSISTKMLAREFSLYWEKLFFLASVHPAKQLSTLKVLVLDCLSIYSQSHSWPRRFFCCCLLNLNIASVRHFAPLIFVVFPLKQ